MKKKAIERREQILKAAFQAVADKGFEAVTLQDIADYAGVSKGVTNYYFHNKEDVFSSLLKWVTNQIYKNECYAINKQTTSAKKLEAYICSVFISPEKNRKFYKVYLDFIAQASRNEHYQQINLQFYENCWGLARDIISHGQDEGVFTRELDIDQASKMIRSIIDGALIQWLMCNEEELHDFYRNSCINTILKLLK
ncbi:TetR/AcrR family transcriptional regulator [Alkalihalobacterium alkalinitrilicum]|uniref:TetR/AcrR family transcriptional regulator n=1 Tax=Alkalihalobacterium alkalinitrilicum TaxID=427920 RepID=UPI000994EA88|nr:TetR/AcrR family transcriptional regulator [Alkalihalobacterium alkalinitrilicum]